MSYSGNVPVKGGGHTALFARNLRPGDKNLLQEKWLASGGPESEAPTEAWFVALRDARRAFCKQHHRYPEKIVFSAEEADRVAALPQMREHSAIWADAVGKRHILPCGLPDKLLSMTVIVMGWK